MIWALHGAVGRSADWLDFASKIQAYQSSELNRLSEVGSGSTEVRRLDLWRFLDCCPMPLEEVGEHLATQIGRVDTEPVMVAYSMGGRLALHALLAKPKMWKGAVIVSAHSGLADKEERVERRQKDAEWSALALKGEWDEFLEAWESQGVLGGAAKMPDRRVLKGRRASIARSFVDWSLGAQVELSERFGEIECPVLWLTGERDVKFTRIAKRVVPLIARGKHEVVAESGHRIPWERPEYFAEICREFIKSSLDFYR